MPAIQNCSFLPSILALSETKLNDESTVPPLTGYTFTNVNSPTTSGGVGFYVSDTLKYSVRPDLSLNIDACEDLWIEVFPELHNSSNFNKNIVVGVIYRHPGHKYDIFNEKLCAQLDLLNRNKKQTIKQGTIYAET